MATQPLVTIITVCKNEIKNIEKTIQSVIYQTYENIEYIVVDGQSDDGTIEVINKYNDHINQLISNDVGIYEAMNAGIDIATGDFILMLNGGDWYEIDAVEALVKSYNAANCDIVSACAKKVDASGKVTLMLGKMPYDDSLYLGMSIRHETMLVPASIYKHMRYNTYYRIISDHDFAIRLYKAGLRHYEIPRCLLNFQDDGVSNNNFDMITDERSYLIRNYLKDLNNNSIKILANEQKLDAALLEKVALSSNDKSIVRIVEAYASRRQLITSNTVYDYIKDPVKISIIIPVHNGQNTIESTLKSVLKQMRGDIEIICVDDKSDDNTRNVIEATITASRLEMLLDNRWDDVSDNITVVENSTNQGVAFSRNLGLRIARGDYVMFLDSDDIILPGSIDRFIREIENNVDIIVGNIRLINSDAYKGIKIEECFKGDVYQLQQYTKTTENFLGAIYKKSMANNILFENYKMGEDSLFWIQALLQARLIKAIDQDVYEYNNMNLSSAQHNYDYEKFVNELEWRERAAVLLECAGLSKSSIFIISKYWNTRVFEIMKSMLNVDEYKSFVNRLDKFVENMGMDEEAAADLRDLLKVSCYI